MNEAERKRALDELKSTWYLQVRCPSCNHLAEVAVPSDSEWRLPVSLGDTTRDYAAKAIARAADRPQVCEHCQTAFVIRSRRVVTTIYDVVVASIDLTKF